MDPRDCSYPCGRRIGGTIVSGGRRTDAEILRATYKHYNSALTISVSEEMKAEILQICFDRNISASKFFRDLYLARYKRVKEA